MSGASRNIGLFGLFGGGNLGNDASLQAIVEFLRESQPGSNLTCICVEPSKISETFGLNAIALSTGAPESRLLAAVDKRLAKAPSRFRNWVWTIRQMRKLDVLIVPGTGILDDFGAGPFGLPYGIFRWCVAARIARAKVYFVSIGAGPIHHPLSRWFMKTAARCATYRSYRDEGSKIFMTSLGVNVKSDSIYPDLAFRLALPAVRASGLQTLPSLTVGLGVMTYYGWSEDEKQGQKIYEAYLEKIAAFAIWLLDGGQNIRLLTGQTPDQRAVDDIIAKIYSARPETSPGRIVSNALPTLHDLMQEIDKTDVVVATRFHNVVSALKMGKPTISIGYAKKNDALMSEMGLQDFCQYIETLDSEVLVSQFENLVARRNDLASQINIANGKFKSRLDQQDMLLGKMLEN